MAAGTVPGSGAGPRSGFRCRGECWFSFPVKAPEDGAYQIVLDKMGGGVWDLLVDGEAYEGLRGLEPGEGMLPAGPPVLLEAGQHSLIFHAPEGADGIHVWRAVSLRPVETGPSGAVETRREWKPAGPHARLLEIGKVFGGSYINVNIARGNALLSRNGYQYLAYFHPEGYLVVGRRRRGSTFFEKYRIPVRGLKAPERPAPGPPNFFLANPHYFISIQMDGEGYLHLAWGHHNNRLKYLRSSTPYEISRWNLPEGPLESAERETSVTYVRFIRLVSGDLLAFFRDGPAGKGSTRLLRYRTAEKKWRTLFDPFVTDDGFSSPYFWRPVVSPDGTVSLAWTWRLSVLDDEEAARMKQNGFTGFSNRDIAFARSQDEGETWTRSDGTRYTMPIRRRSDGNSRAETLVSIPPGESFFNHYGADYGMRGEPHFAYTRRDPASGRISQQWHLFPDGGTWKNVPVTHYSRSVRWRRPQQDGRAGTDIMRPDMLVSPRGKAVLISRNVESGNRIELFSASPPYGREDWKRTVAFDGAVGNWEPQADRDLWHETGRLQMLLVGITDRAVHEDYREANTLGKKLKRMRRDKPPVFTKTAEGNVLGDYYSTDTRVPVQKLDARLREDTGYLIEITYE